MQRICVFMGASDGNDPAYVQLAEDLGTLMGRTGKTLVWGGGTRGLMGRVAAAVLGAGGKLIGVSPFSITDVEGEVFDDGRRLSEVARFHLVRSMERRKAQMMDLAEGFVVLPGGAGTFAEMWPVLDMAKLQRGGMHPGQRKPVIFLAPDDFFDGTMQQIHRSIEKGFMPDDFHDLFRVARTPEEALMRLEGFEAKYRQPRRVKIAGTDHGLPQAPEGTPPEVQGGEGVAGVA